MNRTETRIWSTRTLASLVGIAALAAGCGGGQPEAQTADMAPAPTPPAADTAPAPTEATPPADAAQATTTTTTTPAPAAPPAPPPLTDEQIAMVTDASNTAEVDTSKLAQTKAKDARVKKFAATMIQHHTEALKKQKTLVTKLKITPAESPTVTKMKGDVDAGLATLKGATGADFDKAYIDLQVKMHQETLDTIDKQLLPSAKNEDLKKLLTELRPTVESHLTQAKEIQTALAGAGTTGATGTGTGGTGAGATGTGTGGTGATGTGTKK